MATIYHNPRCSKSRQTLALLREQGAEPEIIEYLRTPQSVSELQAILALPGLEASQLVRTKEQAWKDLGQDLGSLSSSEIVAILADNPKLLERPIVTHNGRACIGRPPENVLDLL